jgi:hypothetical protein
MAAIIAKILQNASSDPRGVGLCMKQYKEIDQFLTNESRSILSKKLPGRADCKVTIDPYHDHATILLYITPTKENPLLSQAEFMDFWEDINWSFYCNFESLFKKLSTQFYLNVCVSSESIDE